MSKKNKSKIKAQAILLKNDFFSTIRHKKWIKEQGGDALAILLSFWIESSKQPNYRVKEDELGLLDLHLKPEPTAERIKQVLDSALESKLIDFEDGFYFNSQIEENQEAYKTKCKNISKGRNETERNKRQFSHNSDTNLKENSGEGGTSPIISSSNINLINKKQYAVDLPCIKITEDEWFGWVLNFHNGNQLSAMEMLVAANDSRMAEGKGCADDSMAYLRLWFSRSLKFDGKSKQTTPQKNSVQPKSFQLTPQQSEVAKNLLKGFLNRKNGHQTTELKENIV